MYTNRFTSYLDFSTYLFNLLFFKVFFYLEYANKHSKIGIIKRLCLYLSFAHWQYVWANFKEFVFCVSKSLLNFSTPSRTYIIEVCKYTTGDLTKVEYLKSLKGDVITTSNPSQSFWVTKIYLIRISYAPKELQG